MTSLSAIDFVIPTSLTNRSNAIDFNLVLASANSRATSSQAEVEVRKQFRTRDTRYSMSLRTSVESFPSYFIAITPIHLDLDQSTIALMLSRLPRRW
jgi:hypothetical protein